MKSQDKLLAALTIVLIFGVFIGITVWTHPQSYSQFLMALGDIGRQIWAGIVILFWVGLGLGVLYAVTHILREHRLVRPGKYGAVQAIHKGRETIVLSANQVDEYEHMQKMYQTVVTMQKALASGRRIVDARTKLLGDEEQEEEVKQLPPPRLPEYVAYEDIQHAIPRGQSLLGVSENGIETCDFEKLMTCWIVGGSSTGKSNTVALKINEALRQGRNLQLVVIDPHAKKQDSLYNRIRGYEPYFLRPVAYTPEQVFDSLKWFLAEFKHRLETGDCRTDILLVVDEVSNIVEMENPYAETKDELKDIYKMLKEIARICGQESRGFGMFGWFISQKAAGLAWLRNVVITVIAHKMNMMSERVLACNQDSALARSMDTWPKGRVAVYGLGFEGTMVLQQPVFSLPQSARSMEDLTPNPYKSVPSYPTSTHRSPLHLVEVDSEGEHEAAYEVERSDNEYIELSELEKKIGEMFFGSERMNTSAIAKELFPQVKGGPAYQRNAAIIADAIRKYASVMKVGA